jgi:MoxR-like ATPase
VSLADAGAEGGNPLRNASPAEVVGALRARIERAVIGKRTVVDLALTCVLAGGHLLLEDVPGVGKTTLALALARATGGTFRRVQCTADLLPSDVTGGLVLDGAGAMRFRPGPIFANVVLADEINRATPRTQSALLEAMNEAQVSVDGESHPLPEPFLVVATQNPLDVHGTFPLPDAQLDRFLVRTSVGYPSREAERAILRGEADGSAIEPVSAEALAALRASVRAVRVHPDLEDWVLDVVAASRSAGAFARGVSPRGAQALVQAARAHAVLHGRSWVSPEDLRTLVGPVLAHRVLVRDDADPDAAVRALADSLPAPA